MTWRNFKCSLQRNSQNWLVSAIELVYLIRIYSPHLLRCTGNNCRSIFLNKKYWKFIVLRLTFQHTTCKQLLLCLLARACIYFKASSIKISILRQSRNGLIRTPCRLWATSEYALGDCLCEEQPIFSYYL